MRNFEVSDPIINTPFDKPKHFWFIREGSAPEKRADRRPSVVYPPSDTNVQWELDGNILCPSKDFSPGYEMVLVNTIRERLDAWRQQKYPGISRTTRELIEWWRRDGRKFRLFYAQLEAAETIIFLREARSDLLQGINVPLDQPSEKQVSEGAKAFQRYACKMATGTGKTTVMGMIAAWSILNKVSDRSNKSFSDIVLVMCPTVTIRYRLAELDPEKGEASIYRTRDLVPPHLIPTLTQGKVLIKNWHDFEVKETQSLFNGAKVIKAGVEETITETIHIGDKTTTARQRRYLTLEDYKKQVGAGLLRVRKEELDETGNLEKVLVEITRYLESDASWTQRVIGREIGGKENILVMNDEAHHAYRIRRDKEEASETDLFGEDEEAEEFFQEATVWIEGLDRIHKVRGINFCVDLSATPYFLGRVGQDTNKPFPWVIYDYPLTDAIEAGLVKIPQFPLRDASGEERAKYFNLWKWIYEQLTPAERGAKKTSPKPEAILKFAHTPVAMLVAEWEKTRKEWKKNEDDDRPPVFILVCKNTRIAKVIYEWIAEDKRPAGISSLDIQSLRNKQEETYTIRVDSKVVGESETENSQDDEMRWMRFTLDTVGKKNWPADSQGKPLYAAGFEALAEKLGRPLAPPGRDVRCIVSVGMLTEGWDCTTVTHIIGIRPFMSQLLCEQVVGRGLRRSSYVDFDEEGRLHEEVSKILGVPFEVVPYKADPQGPPPPAKPKNHVHAIPERESLAITFPRVDGYTQVIRSAITVDWKEVPSLIVDPVNIPNEVQMKATLPSNQGRPSMFGPGRTELLTLNPYRQGRRVQQLMFAIATDISKDFHSRAAKGQMPVHVLFPQILNIVERYLKEKVKPLGSAEVVDVFMAPYYGYVIETLTNSIKPDASKGEAQEVPRYEQHRGPGSTADVDIWTTKEVVPIERSHLNYVIADTRQWEQSASYFIDTHEAVESFVKNAGLGFSIPYFHNGQPHDYVPDFIVLVKPKSKGERAVHLILETKGFDILEEIKVAAARRWVSAVNADGKYGRWKYEIAKKPTEVHQILSSCHRELRI
jgi:type III restriction enzyme